MEDKKDTIESGFDFGMFIDGDNGLQMVPDEQLKEINKKLPKWNIKPPAKYSANTKKDA